jgi:DNA-binding transcriptional regulator YhcF (GntR family)
MLKPEIEKKTRELFSVYCDGEYSVRSLARKEEIPFTTLRDRFKTLIGKDYTSYRGGEGTIHKVIKENMSSLNAKEKEKVEKWYKENKEFILEESRKDKLKGKKFYTEERINKASNNLYFLPFDLSSSPFLKDFRYSPQIEEN